MYICIVEQARHICVIFNIFQFKYLKEEERINNYRGLWTSLLMDCVFTRTFSQVGLRPEFFESVFNYLITISGDGLTEQAIISRFFIAESLIYL